MRGYSILSALLGLSALACLPAQASAQQVWRVAEPEKRYPASIIAETRAPAPNGLPDGLVATGPERGGITRAWYERPTRRYAHAILGDDVEAGILVAELANGRRLKVILPQSEVFEDRYPRIADLDGDGSSEIVTIRSSLARGASVTIYGVNDATLDELASTGFIGTPNRWLNIAAIEPFGGSRAREIAFVKTPHIGGTLFFYRYSKGTLRQVAAMRGFSNHVIGSREMRLAAVSDVDGDGRPELAVPSADRKSLRVVSLQGNGVREIARAVLPSPIDKAIAVIRADDGSTGFVTGTEDGRQVEVRR